MTTLLNPYVKYNVESSNFELRITVGPITSSGKTRDEHLAWCKKRALEYVDSGNFKEALASMLSDLGKHPETQNSQQFCGMFGLQSYMGGDLRTDESMRKFIEGFD